MGLYNSKKKNKTNSKPTSKGAVPQSGAVTMLSEGTVIDGALKLSGDVRIDGIVKGNVSGENRVVIGEKGKVEGDVDCDFLELHGKVEGNVKSKQGVRLHVTATLQGNLHTPKFSIDMGAKFIGTCSGQGNTFEETANADSSKK